MSSPAFRRSLLQVTRRNVQRTSKNLQLSSRRGMASSAGPEKSNDTPWLIGSGLVTAIGAAYILSPPRKKHAHDVAKNAKVPFEKVLPKQEQVQPKPDLMKDDEGNVEDVTESEERAISVDAPKTTKVAEEQGIRLDEGAFGQTDDIEKPEIKEKPRETQRAGTLQDRPEGPTDLGDARQQAKEKNAPKNVAEKTDS